MTRFISLIAVALMCLLAVDAPSAVAQTKEFKTIDELEAAFRKNEQTFEAKSAEIGKLRDAQKDKKAEILAYKDPYQAAMNEAAEAFNAWITMRDNPPADTDPVMAAMEAKNLEKTYYEKLTNFARAEKHVRDLDSQYQGLFNSEAAAYKALEKIWHRRLELLGQTELYNPPFLAEVKVIRENPVSHGNDILYAKSWKPGEDFELIKLNIENHLEAIEDVQNMLATAEQRVDNARREFLAAHQAWGAKNGEYENAIYAEGFFRFTLEMVDVAVATKGGASAPAVFYEAAYRLGEMGNYFYSGEGFEYDIPTVSDDYINLIQKLGAAVDAGRIQANANGRPANPVDLIEYGDTFALDMTSETGAEAIKSIGGFIAGTVYEAGLQKELAQKAGWWSLVASGRWDNAYEAYQKHGGEAFENFIDLYKHISGGGESYSQFLSKTLKRSDWKLSALKDLGVSVGVAAAKEIANDQMVQRRFDIYKELAILEIDWFIKRNGYHDAMWFRERQKALLRTLLEELGQLYVQKFENCCTWEKIVEPNMQIATNQAANIRMMTVELKFSDEVKQDLQISLSGQTKKASGRIDEYDHTIYRLPVYDMLDDAENFAGGDLTLTVVGRSFDDMALDGNPGTQAVFVLSSGDWKDYDSRGAGDQTTKIAFVKPEVSVSPSMVEPKPKEVPVEITFKSVNSFPGDAAVAIFPADEQTWRGRYKEYPHETLNGRLQGTATVKASLEPGNYEVRLDDGFGDEAAVVKFTVGNPGFVIKAKLRGENLTSELAVNPGDK